MIENLSVFSQPPFGGALLECSYSFESLNFKNISPMAEAILNKGFILHPKEPFVATGEDIYELVDSYNSGTINEFTDSLKGTDCWWVTIKFMGKLDDMYVRLGISFYFKEKVAVVYTLEGMISAFSNDSKQAKFERLKAFADVCKNVSEVHRPAFVIMDTESLDPEEFTVELAHQNPNWEPFSEKTFSEAETRELYDWYVNVYGNRNG
jgi:hypothetical protein